MLGICGGQQLLAVVLGSTLIQHIPDTMPDALAHEQPNPRHEPGHGVAIVPGTLLHRIVGVPEHAGELGAPPGGARAGPRRGGERDRRGRRDRGHRGPPRRFCLGVQWHPEFLIDPGDRRIFDALIAAAGMTESASGERIAKWLARAGVASRRDAERLIAEGRVKLNNAPVTHPATFVGAGDLVVVDGRLVDAPERTRLWRYHKPEGLMTTHRDPQGRPTVFEKMPAESAAGGQRRPARPQQRGPAAADQRRRAGATAGTARDRLDQALPGPRVRRAGPAGHWPRSPAA